MRTKVLGAHQRIEIGRGYSALLSSEITLMARVLASVGLTLECAGNPRVKDGIILYAARRPVTNDVVIGGRDSTRPAASSSSAESTNG